MRASRRLSLDGVCVIYSAKLTIRIVQPARTPQFQFRMRFVRSFDRLATITFAVGAQVQGLEFGANTAPWKLSRRNDCELVHITAKKIKQYKFLKGPEYTSGPVRFLPKGVLAIQMTCFASIYELFFTNKF